MNDLGQIIRHGFATDFRLSSADVHKWVDPLTDEQFWKNPFSYGNSVGHLMLHLTGNLNYYVGARIAETGYLRNRDLEFSESRRPAKAEVLRQFDETMAMVVATIERQSEGDWTRPYSAEREPEAQDRFTAVLRCAVHFYHHVGQISYLCRELRKS